MFRAPATLLDDNKLIYHTHDGFWPQLARVRDGHSLQNGKTPGNWDLRLR